MKDFFKEFDKKSQNIFLTDGDTNVSFTYSEASEIVEKTTAKIRTPDKKLVFLFCENSYRSVLNYLAVLKSGHAVLLLNNKLNDDISSELINLYSPEIIFSPGELKAESYTKIEDGNITCFVRTEKKEFPAIFNRLAVLLSTSGTTGSPKLVRLSYTNIESNAASIINYLGITPGDKAVTALPMSYSYGLSVINSHVMAGASLFLTELSFIFKDFWKLFNKYNCTSFAGVPYSYQLLKKSRFEKLDIPSLKTLTQAGGRLSNELIEYFHKLASSGNIKFYVMYGQTEATARISYLPPELLPAKAGSIGIPIPGGEISIVRDDGILAAPGTTGELVYSGQNVMLGYAESRDDLSKQDELNGILHTGDLGYQTEEGLFYITGRLKRFIKLQGLRLNLDEVEKMVETKINIEAACTGNDEELMILFSSMQPLNESDVLKNVSVYYNIKPSFISVKRTGSIPVTNSGKKDYNAISKLF